MQVLSNHTATPTSRIVRVALDGAPYQYRAGQAALVATGPGEPTPYSMASAPHETARDGWLEFLVKVDGSNRFGREVSNLEAGTSLDVSTPFGSFTLPPETWTAPLLFVAGGTGIAPLRSMIREAIHRRSPERLALLYSARTPGEFAYLDEFVALEAQGRLTLTLTLTGNAEDWKHGRGRASVGHMSDLATPESLCFICGPPAMVTEMSHALVSLAVPREHIRTEGW